MAHRIAALPLPGFALGGLRIDRCAGVDQEVAASVDLTLPLIDPEEPRPRPSGAGELAGDPRQRSPALALPLEPILEHEHGDGLALPFPHQPGALAQPDRTAPNEITTVRHGHG